MAVKGLITDIKRYAIHDGPGIRTTVFFKGCPLNCLWCHNPECISPGKDLMYFEYKCIACGLCVKTCPEGILKLTGKGIEIDYQLCNYCEECSEICPSSALEIKGRLYSVPDLLAEIEKDLLFYDSSEGGVTFSGGEPLAQPGFLLEILQECRMGKIHTVLDTSGFAPREVLASVMAYVDIFYYDLKFADLAEQERFTGSNSDLALNNLEMLCREGRGKDIVIRFAVIPGITDTEENVKGLMEALPSLDGPGEIHLLPYHDVREKFRRLGREFMLGELETPRRDKIEDLGRKFSAIGLKVKANI